MWAVDATKPTWEMGTTQPNWAMGDAAYTGASAMTAPVWTEPVPRRLRRFSRMRGWNY